MGLVQTLAGRKTYLDSNVWIYAFEAEALFGRELQLMFEALGDGTLNAAASELVIAEILVGPFREGKLNQAETYQRFIQPRSHLDVLPVTRAVLLEAARLRATSALKLPDAIHVATARTADCEVFLTNGGRIKSIPDLEVIPLRDVIE